MRVPSDFGEFYDRHLRVVRAYVMSRVRQPELVFDLVAETFARALEKRALFDPARGPATVWLLGIAHLVRCRPTSGRLCSVGWCWTSPTRRSRSACAVLSTSCASGFRVAWRRCERVWRRDDERSFRRSASRSGAGGGSCGLPRTAAAVGMAAAPLVPGRDRDRGAGGGRGRGGRRGFAERQLLAAAQRAGARSGVAVAAGGPAVDRRVPVQHPRDSEPVIGFERLGGLHCLPGARARRWSGRRGRLSDAHEPDLSGQWGVAVGHPRWWPPERVGWIRAHWPAGRRGAHRDSHDSYLRFPSAADRRPGGRVLPVGQRSVPGRRRHRGTAGVAVDRHHAGAAARFLGPRPPNRLSRVQHRIRPRLVVLAGPERRDPADPRGARPRSNPTSRQAPAGWRSTASPDSYPRGVRRSPTSRP